MVLVKTSDINNTISHNQDQWCCKTKTTTTPAHSDQHAVDNSILKLKQTYDKLYFISTYQPYYNLQWNKQLFPDVVTLATLTANKNKHSGKRRINNAVIWNLTVYE